MSIVLNLLLKLLCSFHGCMPKSASFPKEIVVLGNVLISLSHCFLQKWNLVQFFSLAYLCCL